MRPAKVALVGAFIGLVGMIPGTSGGTVVVVSGVYDEMIAAFNGLLSRGERRKQLFFLLPLAAGCVAATFLFARMIDNVLLRYPSQMHMFFVGLLIGSVPFLYSRGAQKHFRCTYLIPTAIGFCLLSLLVIHQPEAAAPALVSLDAAVFLKVFGAGFISAATAIIPGVSGSMILLLTGMYSTMIAAIREFNLIILLVMALGALVGFVSCSRLIYLLLKKFYQWTYFAIIGLILASAVKIWPGLSSDSAALTDSLILLAGFCMAMLFHSRSGRDELGQAAQDKETSMIKAVIFDFDGTLADTERFLFDVCQRLSEKHGLKKLSREDLQQFRHLPIHERFKYAGVPIAKLPRLAKEARLIYAEYKETAKPFAGIRELLEELKRENYLLCIVSSGNADMIKRFLQKHDMALFDLIRCGSSLFGKNHAINRVIKRLGIKNDQAVYVGDELRDIEACKKAPVKMIAVSWGYDDKTLLEKAHPDYLVHSPEQIGTIVRQLT